MSRGAAGACILVPLLAMLACRQPGGGARGGVQSTGDARAVAVAARRARAVQQDSVGPIALWILPKSLAEISGIATLSDGRVVAHDDERARVVVLDPERGVVLKEFVVGHRGIKGDFEGITVAPDAIYLMTSNGLIYAFHEGADRAEVPYTRFDTRLGKECEFEGIAFDAAERALVLPCKHAKQKGAKRDVVLFRVALPLSKDLQITRSAIDIEQFRARHDWKGLHPSDIAIDPTTGNYVLVASLEHAILEITPDGRVVFAEPLPGRHPQAEGVAFSRDGDLIVSDEANQGAATIALYRWPLFAQAAMATEDQP